MGYKHCQSFESSPVILRNEATIGRIVLLGMSLFVSSPQDGLSSSSCALASISSQQYRDSSFFDVVKSDRKIQPRLPLCVPQAFFSNSMISAISLLLSQLWLGSQELALSRVNV